MNSKVEDEVLRLHSFFEEWFNGMLDNTDDVFQQRFRKAMHEQFTFCPPDGRRIPFETLSRTIRERHGVHQNDESGSITINIRDFHELTADGGLSIVEYREWQAINGEEDGRFTTAVFVEDGSAPGGVAWFRVHETSI